MTRPHDTIFPVEADPDSALTKREYFAAAILQGYLANPNRGTRTSSATIAHLAVQHADLLIQALNDRHTPNG